MFKTRIILILMVVLALILSCSSFHTPQIYLRSSLRSSSTAVPLRCAPEPPSQETPPRYGFDGSDPDSEANQSKRRDAKLRKSLDDSASFKMKNDARFTWLTITASLWGYAYLVLDKEIGATYLPLIGVPNLGLPGAILSLLIGALSAVLFVDPGFFRRR